MERPSKVGAVRSLIATLWGAMLLVAPALALAQANRPPTEAPGGRTGSGFGGSPDAWFWGIGVVIFVALVWLLASPRGRRPTPGRD